jgi:hypothetical protein
VAAASSPVNMKLYKAPNLECNRKYQCFMGVYCYYVSCFWVLASCKCRLVSDISGSYCCVFGDICKTSVIRPQTIFCHDAASGCLIESEGICIRHSRAHSVRAGRPEGRSLSPGEGKIFLLSTWSRLFLESTQPPIKWAPGVLSLVVRCTGCETNTYLQLLPWSTEHGSIHPLPHTSSWRSA